MSDHTSGHGGMSATGSDGRGVDILPASSEARDHYTLAPLPWLAGCSDVGQRHETNQDALALAGRGRVADQVAVMVVSDGVSTSLGSERSSSIAAEVVSTTLVAMLRSLPASPEQIQATLTDSFLAANDAVMSSSGNELLPGSCTLVAAVVADGLVSVGNVGDCRAYWIGDDQEVRLLSVDDSVAQARMELGMSREEAEHGFQAHAITRWIGPDSSDVTPRMVQHRPSGSGWLVVCSDGLWNYASEPGLMRPLVQEVAARADGDAAQAVELLVRWANEQGGRDNITVALARVEQVLATDG
ncbi:hypothetical protein GCM10027030_12510 [Luteococcus sediminum]